MLRVLGRAPSLMILRPYQQDLVHRTRLEMRSAKAIIIQLCTGAGKTPTACEIIRLALEKNSKVLFMAHRTELLSQASQKLTQFGIAHALVKAGRPGNIHARVQVASVQTLVRRMQSFAGFSPQLVVIDECHLAEAASYKRILATMCQQSYVIGLTATPGRLDGRGLGKPAGNFDRILCGPTMEELIAQGYLVPLRFFSCEKQVDVSGIKLTHGDYNTKALTEMVDKPAITGDVIDHWQRLARGRKTLVFCVSIEHADHVAAQFRDAGIEALAVNGKWDDDLRAQAIADFERGGIDVLVNCQLFTEGVDIPAVSCIADLAWTQSLTRYLQRAGRGMRPYPGKSDCIYLDHANNLSRFGFPTEPREWTLAGAETKKKSQERALSVRVCPGCFAASPQGSQVCVDCGRPFEVKSKRDVDTVDGELQEVKPPTPEELAARAMRREQGRARTLEQLQEIGRRLGHAPGWAMHVFNARRKKEMA